MKRASTLVVLLALGALHCSGSESPGEASPRGETGGSSNQGTGGESGDGEEGPLAINGCKADAYVDRTATDADRTVLIGAEGVVYTPRCMTVAVGQTVRWEGRLSAHPTLPGNADDAAAGSPDNPILPTSSGSSVEFTFEKAGTFPYYCELHSSGAGNGMAGAIHVAEF